jgi:hypothetical protein
VLKRNITYEDFDGNQVTDTFYFNLTRTEILDVELGYEGGMEEFITKVIAAEDLKTLIKEFKKIILLSYGERTPDGKRFIKSDRIREEFSQTAAYDALFMELATNDGSAADFVIGIIPRDMASGIPPKTEVVNLPPVPPQVT